MTFVHVARATFRETYRHFRIDVTQPELKRTVRITVQVCTNGLRD